MSLELSFMGFESFSCHDQGRRWLPRSLMGGANGPSLVTQLSQYPSNVLESFEGYLSCESCQREDSEFEFEFIQL